MTISVSKVRRENATTDGGEHTVPWVRNDLKMSASLEAVVAVCVIRDSRHVG